MTDNESNAEYISQYSSTSKIDPTEFDLTITSLLVGLGAEKYIEVFKKHNIGQCTLMELSDEDLMQLGVDDASIRDKIRSEVKSLPIFEVNQENVTTNQMSDLNPLELGEVFEDSSQHLYRIYLSILANTLAVKKTKNIPDCILHEDKYASDIGLATLSEITKILNNMEVALHTELKVYTKEKPKSKTKKLIVGTVGSVAIAVLAVLFVQSLKKI